MNVTVWRGCPSCLAAVRGTMALGNVQKGRCGEGRRVGDTRDTGEKVGEDRRVRDTGDAVCPRLLRSEKRRALREGRGLRGGLGATVSAADKTGRWSPQERQEGSRGDELSPRRGPSVPRPQDPVVCSSPLKGKGGTHTCQVDPGVSVEGLESCTPNGKPAGRPPGRPLQGSGAVPPGRAAAPGSTDPLPPAGPVRRLNPCWFR